MLKVPNRYNAVEGGVLILTILSVNYCVLTIFILKPIIQGWELKSEIGIGFSLLAPFFTYIGGYRRYISGSRYKKIIENHSKIYKDRSLFSDLIFILGLILLSIILVLALMAFSPYYK